jgi:hypothetical protein
MKTIRLIALLVIAYAPVFGQQTNNWVLNTSKDGVEFFVTNITSNISNTQNTVVKIHNTNPYQISLMFVVSIKCGKNGAVQKQAPKSVFIEPGDESSLHTYKICQGAEEVMVTIEGITVEQRQGK